VLFISLYKDNRILRLDNIMISCSKNFLKYQLVGHINLEELRTVSLINTTDFPHIQTPSW